MDRREKSIVAPGHYGIALVLQSDAMPSTRGPAHELMREAEAAYREAYPLIMTMARNAGFNEVEQREIAQRVGLVLVEKVDEYDASKGTRRMWAAGIARNVLLDARRAARAERRRTDRSGALKQIPSPTLTPEETLRARESLVLLRAGVRAEHRAVLELDAQGCTAAEIAEMLGLSLANVHWRLREVRKDLDSTLVTLGEDRKEITRVRSAFFFGAAFEALSRTGHFPEATSRGSPPPPNTPPCDVRQSLPRDVRPSFSRLWGAVQSVVPLAMAAVVVLVPGRIVGGAAGFDGLAGAADRILGVSAPTPEVPCSVTADSPREVPAETPEQVVPMTVQQPPPPLPSVRSARRREWLVIRTLVGLRRDAEAAESSTISGESPPRSRANPSPGGQGRSIFP